MHPVMFTVYVLLVTSVLCQPTSGQLTTDPVELAVEPGEDAEFTCIWEDGDNTTKLEILSWHRIHINSTHGKEEAQEGETKLKNSTTVKIEKGTISIQNVSFADAGRYTCRDDSGAEPAEVELIVYNMPSYGTEGVIVVCLVAGLLLVLGVGLALQAKTAKRSRLQREKQGRLGTFHTLPDEEQS